MAMALIAGVDVGNDTTEVAVAQVASGGVPRFLSSSLVSTVGVKGTVQNVTGIIDALDKALLPLGHSRTSLSLVLLNEASPVIADIAMETITETVITESAMIGHDPSTPGGMGLGFGMTVDLGRNEPLPPGGPYIVIVPGRFDFHEAAARINEALDAGVDIRGVIVQKDDGVLIANRLRKPLPIVDEVQYLEKIPLGMLAAVEVAAPGRSIEKLSNPYDLATLFGLSAEETRNVVPIARALMGTRSAVVIKTPRGDIQERRIPAGKLILIGQRLKAEAAIEEGADAIMAKAQQVAPLVEIQAEPGTHVGGMFERVRKLMAELTDQPVSVVRVQDILAVDTLRPQKIHGGLAGEQALGNAVALAAMVETQKLPMQRVARKLEEEILVPVKVGGAEAQAAILGALTTPGTKPPMAIVDLGGGSTDASFINEKGQSHWIHLAGAGDMVTRLIDSELGLDDADLAEKIKRYPLARAESLFHLRHENGTVQFFEKAMDPRLFGRVVALTPEGPIPVPSREPLSKIAVVRTEAKKKVFVRNTLRALRQVAPSGNIRQIQFVTLVGGSALDFQIPHLLSDTLTEFGIVTGRANVRGSEGPRNAVATGLVLAHCAKENGWKWPWRIFPPAKP